MYKKHKERSSSIGLVVSKYFAKTLTSATSGSFVRNGRPEVFSKNGVLRNFTKLTEKHLCQSLFFNKLAGSASEKLSF